jgi:hypothetical protein
MNLLNDLCNRAGIEYEGKHRVSRISTVTRLRDGLSGNAGSSHDNGRDLCNLHRVQIRTRTLSKGYGGGGPLCLKAKQIFIVTINLSRFNVEFKNAWSYIYIPPYV